MRRDALALLLLLLLLVLLGLFGWLTRQPAAPFFERAERAPVVGSVVAALRQRYLDEAPAVEGEGAPAGASAPGPAAAAGSGREPGAAEVVDREWIGVGAMFRAGPGPDAVALGRTRELLSYEVLERRGSWLRVRSAGGVEGWVDLAAPPDGTPPLGEAPLPPGPLAARAPDPARLQAALALLAAPRHEGRLGGYVVYHDLDPAVWSSLAPWLETAVVGGEELYAERYGLEPIGAPAEALVLFREEASYRELQLAQPELGRAPTTGHAAGGLVALFAGARSPREIASTLAHEVGHLLARRSLGPALPPWLDEGLADDFATVMVARADGGDPYRGWRTVSPGRVDYAGPLAVLLLLRERLAAGRLVPLDELVAMPRDVFYAEPDRERLYGQSAFFVRCLIERGTPAQAGPSALRRYLGAVRAGGAVGGDALLASLAATWSELELAFRACLLHESSRAGLEAAERGRAGDVRPLRAPPAASPPPATSSRRHGSARASRSAPLA